MADAVPHQEVRPNQLTVAAFTAVVLIGGANFVAAHFSNQELSPSFGAGLRFAGASVVFLALVGFGRIPLPGGRALAGAALFGLFLAAANALSFWALLQLPAGMAGLIFALVPLLTLFFALLHGLESFRWRGVVGGMLALVGIGILRIGSLGADLPLAPMVAMVGAAACAAEAGVVIKRFPPSHPMATNGLAMAIGAILLFIASRFLGEPWSVPSRAATWLALGHLVLLGSVSFFALYLFILKRWTASCASYSIVLMPLVTVMLAAWLAGQPVSTGVVLGGAIILAGVYVGALSHERAAPPQTAGQEALVQRCSSC